MVTNRGSLRPWDPIFFRQIRKGALNATVGNTPPAPQGSITFEFTGAFVTWEVPAGVILVEIEHLGAQGGSITSGAQPLKAGGLGQSVVSQHAVAPGDTIYVYVGEQPTTSSAGFPNGGRSNGGAASSGKGGGGRSETRLNTNSSAFALSVAAGGGGAGAGFPNSRTNAAGGYGGSTGQDGENGQTATNGRGRGATSGAGGAGGIGDNNWAGDDGTAGTGLQGGVGGDFHGGGGGDGIFGGGGAGGGLGPGGGGGGSGGMVDGGGTLISSTDNTRSGHGQVTITWGPGI